MSEFRYETNAAISALAERIRGAQRIFVTTHARPDGDAIGSVLAVLRSCRALGVRAEGWLIGPCEENLLSLKGETPLELIDPQRPRTPEWEPDLIVIVDTGAWTQLELLAAWLRPRAAKTIGLDHHARGDLVAAERVVDVSCGSCTALIARLVRELGVELTFGADARGRGSVAEALYLGLATDTGWFRLPNARGPEFALAAELLEAGVDKNRLFAVIEETQRPERLAIEGRALTSLRYCLKGSVAIARLSREDFSATGARIEELSGLVNRPLAIGRVRASVLLTEVEGGVVKMSFRSKPASPEGAPNDFIDVNAIAARFGGGGHVHAAGARLRGTLDEAERAVVEALEA